MKLNLTVKEIHSPDLGVCVKSLSLNESLTFSQKMQVIALEAKISEVFHDTYSKIAGPMSEGQMLDQEMKDILANDALNEREKKNKAKQVERKMEKHDKKMEKLLSVKHDLGEFQPIEVNELNHKFFTAGDLIHLKKAGLVNIVEKENHLKAVT